MAYTKTTWNNLSDPPINADNLNKIEQGIYNNSLGIDKINPGGTATTTVEIEEGQITDVIGFKSLKLKGQTSQYTTTGKNIFPRITFSQTINGVTITATGDGTIKIKGTANSSGVNHPIWGAWGSSTTLFTIPAGTYTASGIGTRQQSPRMNIVTNGTTSIFVTNTTQTLDSDTNVTGIFIWVDAGTTVDTTFKYQIEEGSTATSFEPYTGKKASPNPDFPQDVNNVSGDNVIRISNKNLIEDETFVQGTFNESSGTKRISCRNIKLKANTTYTLSTNLNYSTYNVAIVTSTNKFPIQASETPKYDSGWKTANFSFTTGNDDVYANIAVKKVGELVIAPSDVKDYHFQLEKGNTATSFVAHQGNNFEINLGKNLFNKDDSSLIMNNVYINPTGYVLTAANNMKTICMPCKPNTTYTVSKVTSARFVIGSATSNTTGTSMTTGRNNFTGTQLTLTTGANDKYLFVFYYNGSADTLSEETIRNSIQIEVGSTATSYSPYFPPIEICKIGTYQDYIYKKDGKWWKHKAIRKIVLNGTESWVLDGALTNTNRFRMSITSYNIQNIALTYNGFSNQLQILNAYSDESEHLYTYKPSDFMNLYVFYTKTRCADLAGLQTWLSANNLIIYGILNTPIDEEITYTPLIRQLDELYNSGLYDVTNISQDNSSEAFILDLEACKNNINGIVEYIRR